MRYPTTKLTVFDLEVYRSWFLAGFQVPDGTYYQFSTEPGGNIELLPEFLRWLPSQGFNLVGFNSNGYDDPVLHQFLTNDMSTEEAYKASVDIIVNEIPGWTFRSTINSIDAMQLLPGRIGLKKVGVCLGHHKLQELPVDPHSDPTPDQIQILKAYNINDLDITRKLLKVVEKDLTLRGKMSEEYGIDLRSKGDAAMAEAILLAEYKKAGGHRNKKQLNAAGTTIVEQTNQVSIFEPSWWKYFQTNVHRYPETQEVLNIGDRLFTTPVALNHYHLPKGVLDKTLFLDDRYYSMGVGGLHSIDGPGAWIPAPDEMLVDIDVASYYPMIALTQKISPRQWTIPQHGDLFQPIYKSLVERRLSAKASGDTATAYSLKIAVNGTYGKSSDMFSCLYDPQMTINVTVLGQLGLLVLIGMISGTGYVVSANTDGISVLFKKRSHDRLKEIVAEWEQFTGFTMEYTYYKALYQKDVNNYIALTVEGKLKKKGRFVDKWPDLHHTPNANIVATSINQMVRDGTPIEQTIYECADINQFLLTQSVSKGWTVKWNEKDMGHMLRFYKSTRPDAAPIMRYPGPNDTKGKAGVVSNSDYCVPVADLPTELPPDIKYAWYHKEAYDLWSSISALKIPGRNRWGEHLHSLGFKPCYVDLSANTWSRAAVVYGSTDFSSCPEGWVWGTGTGDHLLGKFTPGDHSETEVYWVDSFHPNRSRQTIFKKMGFTLHYNARIPLIAPYYELLPSEPGQFDSYYTPAEWRTATEQENKRKAQQEKLK